VATDNLYTPEVLTLEGGLDFVTPRTQAAPGALLDCLNYEVADRLGYKRIDGIDWYDGRPNASLAYESLYKGLWENGVVGHLPTVGTFLYLTTSSSSAGSFGAPSDTFAYVTAITAVSTTSEEVEFVVFNTDIFYKVVRDPTLVIRSSASPTGSGNLTGVTNQWLYDGDTLVSQRVADAVTAYQSIMNNTSACPLTGNGAANLVPGLNYYKNNLYAIQDIAYFYFDTGSLTDTIINSLLPNDKLHYSTYDFLVRDVEILSGSWADGNATGIVYVSFLGTNDGGGFVAGGVQGTAWAALAAIPDLSNMSVIRGGGPTTIANALRINSALTNGTVAISTTNPVKYASLLKANTITDLEFIDNAEDNVGWQEVELGYMFQFGAATTNSSTTGAPTQPVRTTSPVAAQVTSTLTTEGFAPAGTGNVTDSRSILTFSHTASAITIASMITAASSNHRPYGGNGNAATDPAQCLTQLVTGAVNEATYGAVAIFGATGGVTYNNSEEYVLKNFTFPEVPDDAIILGITVDVGGYSMPTGGYGGTTYSSQIAVRLQTDSPSSSSLTPQISTPKNSVISGSSVTPAVLDKVTNLGIANCVHFVIGGASDTWGLTSLTPALLSTLQVRLSTTVYNNHGAGVAAAGITGVRVTVYYTKSSSVFYFNNGIDDVVGTITNTYVDNGQVWTDGSTGTMQVIDVKPYSTATRNRIQSGDTIYILPGGSGTVGQKAVATVSNDMYFAGLPSSAVLNQNSSRYEFVNANFYANADWEAMYGVSGAGPAFSYDAFYFHYIFTGTPAALEKPRHVATHNEHLVLAYQSGSFIASAAGSPEDFSGLDGATEFSTGDYITGLLKLDGTTLGVFCKNSIWGISGTDSTTWSQNILSPHEGAIEYTIVDAGRPIYCTYRGISTFVPSAGYGNFTAGRLSANITPWLLPRLTGDVQSLDVSSIVLSGKGRPPNAAVSSSPICAYPVKSKNQYRVVFRDGYELILTMAGEKELPVFTIAHIKTSETVIPPYTLSSYLTTLGVAYSVNRMGRDVIYMTSSTPDNNAYVYERDRGWGFLNHAIDSYFTTTYNFLDNPFQKAKLAKVRLHGLSRGLGTLTLSVSADYLTTDFTSGDLFGHTLANSSPQDISLPRDGGNVVIGTTGDITNDYRPYTNLTNMAKEGSNLAFQILSEPATIEPPHICQGFMLQITTNKADV